MYVLIILCCGVGFFCLYNISSKAKLASIGIYQKWLQQNPVWATISGVALLLCSLVFFIIKDGPGVGGFSFFLLLMGMGGCVIVLAPLHYLKQKHILLFIFIGLFLNFFYSNRYARKQKIFKHTGTAGIKNNSCIRRRLPCYHYISFVAITFAEREKCIGHRLFFYLYTLECAYDICLYCKKRLEGMGSFSAGQHCLFIALLEIFF